MASEIDSFEDCLAFAIESAGISFALYDEQVQTLKKLYSEIDTVAVLPTGFGKSLIYQLLPHMLQKKFKEPEPMIVLVVAPLNSIMEDQVQRLNHDMHGLKGCYISYDAKSFVTYECKTDDLNDDDDNDDDNVDDEDDDDYDKGKHDQVEILTSCDIQELKEGKFNIIYSHPEALKNKEVFRILMSKKYSQRVCAIVVDEVHIIAEWGDKFRPAFNRIGELTCLFANACHLALTATCTPGRLIMLTDVLQYQNYHVVKLNPDRTNIFINVKTRLPNNHKFRKLDDLIQPIATELNNTLSEFPVTIIYMENLDALGYFYKYLDHTLKANQYIGDHIPENRLFAQYHKDYTSSMKSFIVHELTKEIPRIRLVLATVALGMGLNAPSIVRIIHCRPPSTLEGYMQEIGRAGRQGQKAEAILYYNKNDISRARKGLTNAMIEFCKNEDNCLRLQLIKYFGFSKVQFSGDKRDCCSNCFKSVDSWSQ